MATSKECPLALVLAQWLREGRNDIVKRWLERIADRITVGRNEIFPTDYLLDHVPLLVDGIADYLEDPADEITVDMPVVAKAIELGQLRHEQGFDVHQILKEYEILGGVLFDFLVRRVDETDEPCTRGELLICAHRIFRSIAVIQQHTTGHFLRLAEEAVREREERLRGFNRMVSHELKNRIGAARGASEMLLEDALVADVVQRRKFASMVSKNLDTIQKILDDLIQISHASSTGDFASGRNILLADAAAEVKRQLREFTESRHVSIVLADDLPYVEIPAGVVELALSNFISNGVKYRDTTQSECWVRVEAELMKVEGGCEVVVRTRDNGLGVPEASRDRLFERFFRAHEDVSQEEGSGLGLSIVRDTLLSIGGRAWAEFPEEGSVFAFAVPCLPSKPKPSETAPPAAIPGTPLVPESID